MPKMGYFIDAYMRRKAELLADASICNANRDLFRAFFEYEEYKLKRRNGLSDLDEACGKTLLLYVLRLRNVNLWFENKPWNDLTKEDIKRVYDALEDGLIVNRAGKPFGDRASYYSKVFKSKPFRLAGKADLAREVIEFHTVRHREVRYVTEETFRTMTSVVSNPRHLLLFWLHWDIGENIDTLLRLTKRDFIRQKNPDTGEAEYLVNLPREKIKRSRQTRSEPTLYAETVRYADMALNGLGDDDPIFLFGYRQALKLIHAAVKKSGARCMPNGEPVRWKDLRSGMACHLLRSGWSRDEVNARLGHRPSSDTLDAYINYLALDRHRPKKKLQAVRLSEIHNELEEAKRREKMLHERLRKQGEENTAMKKALSEIRSQMGEFRSLVQRIGRARKETRTPRAIRSRHVRVQ
ncbi:MAG: hypothetical protein NTW86_10470 [Candidatus Sumerlaeota bacterium]|nr:hypothetical protein [Candidatus Sumerlaeota bacterium]